VLQLSRLGAVEIPLPTILPVITCATAKKYKSYVAQLFVSQDENLIAEQIS
jgi:hypothetical protein